MEGVPPQRVQNGPTVGLCDKGAYRFFTEGLAFAGQREKSEAHGKWARSGRLVRQQAPPRGQEPSGLLSQHVCRPLTHKLAQTCTACLPWTSKKWIKSHVSLSQIKYPIWPPI